MNESVTTPSTAPTDASMFEGPLPDTTLPRVQFPTGRPFDIQVEIPDTFEQREAVKRATHMWKVTYSRFNGVDHEWTVKGGEVVTQGGTFTVPDLTVTGDEGYVSVQLTRDEASREVTNAEIDSLITSLSPSTSDQQYQYIALAYVSSTFSTGERVQQLRYERLEILEELQVINGSLKLNAYRVAHDNSYDPPP